MRGELYPLRTCVPPLTGEAPYFRYMTRRVISVFNGIQRGKHFPPLLPVGAFLSLSRALRHSRAVCIAKTLSRDPPFCLEACAFALRVSLCFASCRSSVYCRYRTEVGYQKNRYGDNIDRLRQGATERTVASPDVPHTVVERSLHIRRYCTEAGYMCLRSKTYRRSRRQGSIT